MFSLILVGCTTDTPDTHPADSLSDALLDRDWRIGAWRTRLDPDAWLFIDTLRSLLLDAYDHDTFDTFDVTSDELCALLQIHERTLTRWMKKFFQTPPDAALASLIRFEKTVNGYSCFITITNPVVPADTDSAISFSALPMSQPANDIVSVPHHSIEDTLSTLGQNVRDTVSATPVSSALDILSEPLAEPVQVQSPTTTRARTSDLIDRDHSSDLFLEKDLDQIDRSLRADRPEEEDPDRIRRIILGHFVQPSHLGPKLTSLLPEDQIDPIVTELAAQLATKACSSQLVTTFITRLLHQVGLRMKKHTEPIRNPAAYIRSVVRSMLENPDRYRLPASLQIAA